MGPFQWLTTHWTPVIEYRDYAAIEVEDIAWGSTLIGSRRGFLVGFPAGALCIVVIIIGGVALTRLYNPSAPTTPPSQGQQEATASRALSAELSTLREENRALKQQVRVAKAATTCPPCPPQAPRKVPPQTQAVAAPPQPSKQATTRPAKKPSATVPHGQVSPPQAKAVVSPAPPGSSWPGKGPPDR